MSKPTYSEAELAAAVEALSEPDRFREAEQLVATAAPALQKVLAEALAAGGWFEDSHRSAVGDAAGRPELEQRVTAVRSLLAEEGRIAMMIGVAVGWALADELGRTTDTEEITND